MWKRGEIVKWILLVLLLVPVAHAKVLVPYPPTFGESADYRDRLTLPHLYPGQSRTTDTGFMLEPLHRGSSTVRWTPYSSYAIHLDRVHLERNSFTLRIKTKHGWSIRQLPFETTKLYLPPNYYDIKFDESSYTLWMSKYAE